MLTLRLTESLSYGFSMLKIELTLFCTFPLSSLNTSIYTELLSRCDPLRASALSPSGSVCMCVCPLLLFISYYKHHHTLKSALSFKGDTT